MSRALCLHSLLSFKFWSLIPSLHLSCWLALKLKLLFKVSFFFLFKKYVNVKGFENDCNWICFAGLRQGEITPQHLVQQLQNPASQPRHREVLASILKLHGGSPRPASPHMVPPDPALIQQLMLQQQLRIPSPLPPMHNGECLRNCTPLNRRLES